MNRRAIIGEERMVLRHVRELVGKSVIGSNGRIFGTVDDVALDVDTWTVAAIIIKVESRAVADLGLSKPLWKSARVEIPASVIGKARDVVILTVSLEEFGSRLKTAVPVEPNPDLSSEKPDPPPA